MAQWGMTISSYVGICLWERSMTEHPGYELMRQTPGAELCSMTAFLPGWGFTHQAKTPFSLLNI